LEIKTIIKKLTVNVRSKVQIKIQRKTSIVSWGGKAKMTGIRKVGRGN